MNDRERAKEWIDEISTQEVDRILHFLNLCLSKRDLYYEKCELKKEIEQLHQELQRKDNIINEIKKWLEDYIKLFDNPDTLEEQTLEDLQEVLDKIKEIESK